MSDENCIGRSLRANECYIRKLLYCSIVKIIVPCESNTADSTRIHKALMASELFFGKNVRFSLLFLIFFPVFFFKFGNPYFIEMTSLAYYEKIKNVILICGRTSIFEILHRCIIERYSANVWHSLMRRIK